MLIGIDVRELAAKPTGVGRYLSQLLRHWAAPPARLAARHQFLLYSPTPLAPSVTLAFQGLGALVRIVPGSPGTWWEQVRLPRAINADHLDVFFAPAYTAPLAARCPTVVTIHDLSYIAHPEWFPRRERLRRSWLTRLAARRSKIVLSVSEFSGREIQRLLGLTAERIRIIPHGVALPGAVDGPAEADATGKPVVRAGFAGRRPLVLFAGSIFNRRRVPDMIRAFARAAIVVPGARLEIVGENRTFPHQDLTAICAGLGIADRVGLRAFVSDEELTGLYGQARVFAFLSEYEGFGLTPLEALSCGIPVVVADTPVAREVCGPGARYVRTGDIDGIAAAFAELLTDDAAHARALEAAPVVLARYSWPDAARATIGALESAAR